MNIGEWIEQVAGTTLRQVALATEIPVPTLARQVREDAVTPETVVRIARHYSASPLGGLVAIGLLSPAEAKTMSVGEALSRATDLELAQEAIRRIEAGVASGTLTRDVNEVDRNDPDAVAEFLTEGETRADELRKAREAKNRRPPANLPTKKSARPKNEDK